jgi:hydroxypyruvate isomerase
MDFTKNTLNCSILYGALPVRDALHRATAAGFIDVEFWWPFTTAAPDDDELTAFLQAVADSGVRLKGMNLFAGNMAGGDRGVLSWPGREAELHSSVAVARRVADATGCAIFNALYGRRQPTVDPAEQDELALITTSSSTETTSIQGQTSIAPQSQPDSLRGPSSPPWISRFPWCRPSQGSCGALAAGPCGRCSVPKLGV